MKQPNLNRDWLEQYKTIPKENPSIYRNTYNPHESSIPGTPQSHFEKAMMPAYGVGTQQMEEQIRAHPAFGSMPPSIRERPIGDVLNYFKQPEMVNRIKFNQDLEGIKNQRQTNYNNQLSNLQTQHNQRMAVINSPANQREQKINQWAQYLENNTYESQYNTSEWLKQNNITQQDAKDIMGILGKRYAEVYKQSPAKTNAFGGNMTSIDTRFNNHFRFNFTPVWKDTFLKGIQ